MSKNLGNGTGILAAFEIGFLLVDTCLQFLRFFGGVGISNRSRSVVTRFLSVVSYVFDISYGIRRKSSAGLIRIPAGSAAGFICAGDHSEYDRSNYQYG